MLEGGRVSGWISSVSVGGSKSRRVSWIKFDEEALFSIWDETGVFGFTDHLASLRISSTAWTDDDVLGFTKVHSHSQH